MHMLADVEQSIQALWGTHLVWKEERDKDAMNLARATIQKHIGALSDECAFITRGILLEADACASTQHAVIEDYFDTHAPLFLRQYSDVRAYLLAGDFLYTRNQLPNDCEQGLLKIAQMHVNEKDTMTTVLARRTICRFSEDAEEIEHILRNVQKSGSSRQYVILAHAGIPHLPTPAVREISECIVDFSQSGREPEQKALARFYERAIDRMISTLIALREEASQQHLESTPIMLDYERAIERAFGEILSLEGVDKEQALVAVHLAQYARCVGDKTGLREFLKQGREHAKSLNPDDGGSILSALQKISDPQGGGE